MRLFESINVSAKVTHYRPHPDEAIAGWFLERFGLNLFPGADQAPWKFFNAGRQTPDGRSAQDWINEGVIPLGIWNSPWDDHGRGYTTAATLVAESLGLTQDPLLKPFLEYALQNDRNGGRTPFDLASWLRVVNAHTITGEQVMAMTSRLMNAKYNRMVTDDPSFTPHAYWAVLDGLVAEWLWTTFGRKIDNSGQRPSTARATAEVLKLCSEKGQWREDLWKIGRFIDRDHTMGTTTEFDLVAMFSDLVEDGASAEYQRAFIFVTFDAYFAQQRRFMAAVDEVAAKATVTWVGERTTIERLQRQGVVKETDKIRFFRGAKPYKVVSVVSNSEEAVAAIMATYDGTKFVVRQTTDKHMLVAGPCHLMDEVARAVRRQDNIWRTSGNGPFIPEADLAKPDNIPGDPAWCYHKEGGRLLNSSLTAPYMPATMLGVYDVITCIGTALQKASADQKAEVPAPRPETPASPVQPPAAPAVIKKPRIRKEGVTKITKKPRKAASKTV
jgi:hypothetical protein